MNSLARRFQGEVFHPYLELLKAEHRIHAGAFGEAKRAWDACLTAAELVRGPYLEKAQFYAQGQRLDGLPIGAQTASAVGGLLRGRNLYKHQSDALSLLLQGRNAIIASGTSSGKTLCYQIPILDNLLRDPSSGLRAIIIYPLNALVNDQLKEWEKLLTGHAQITFARFTGQTPSTQAEYEERLKFSIREQLRSQSTSQRELQRLVTLRLREQLEQEPRNHLRHRDAIRTSPPHILITNFSMLEYLLERPVDAPIFDGAQLKFLVLDEVHAYRGPQATEIAFLIRRLKDRLQVEHVTCVATSATLGVQGDHESEGKVRRFASDLFDEDFPEPNPISGTSARPVLRDPSVRPTAVQYIQAAARLREQPGANVVEILGLPQSEGDLSQALGHDENLHMLRSEILAKPIPLFDAAEKLWPGDPGGEEALQCLLEVVAQAKSAGSQDDLLPTRLHYFLRAQGGFHICLHMGCPARSNGRPSFYASRKTDSSVPEGQCPACFGVGRSSHLVEIVSCRKCGYLFGGLQDLGPRRAQAPDTEGDAPAAAFDSFSTDLGWAADSFWSYFSVDDELPYPPQPQIEPDGHDAQDLISKPVELDWCVQCGKKCDPGVGDNCHCPDPHVRTIQIFHRQCPHFGRPRDRQNLFAQEKAPLSCCPNCGARNASGLEPLHRFQESDDESGLAIAIPFSQFEVSPPVARRPDSRKLLCFTDHRQRAAAFPSLLEEETFAHYLGRTIVRIVTALKAPMTFEQLGDRLADMTDPTSSTYDARLFLPASRLPDEEMDERRRRDLWVAEVFGYFGIPDSARESAEDLGLVGPAYRIDNGDASALHAAVGQQGLAMEESAQAVQVMLTFMRHHKAMTLPKGRVGQDTPAFGRVTADIGYSLESNDALNLKGWIPKGGAWRDNYITNYLARLLRVSPEGAILVAKSIWECLTSRAILVETRGRWKLDHERLIVSQPRSRFVCDRCSAVTTFSARACCPRKGCSGRLVVSPFKPSEENIVANWVAGTGPKGLGTIRSEEHTAQISKDLAAAIEEDFRAQGIDVLSSTTTFELGLNIGDLQKVLLRNAPPTGASYVQRVGRTGRGEERNSVCVTLCRRTKYDADSWADPARLMSGSVRPPAVFTANSIIAQRHFNAVAFTAFLRTRLLREGALGELSQRIRLEAFIPPASRERLPEEWRRVRPTGLFLDFPEWIQGRREDELVRTGGGRSLLDAVSGFASGVDGACAQYRETVRQIASELDALLDERASLFKKGQPTGDIEQAARNLLGNDVIGTLARRAFLPRYAFPLDVVSLETGRTRWSRDVDVELSRDRGIAIAEFAPGAQVVAHKKVFTSAGLYVLSKLDAPDRRWYSLCPGCGQIRTGDLADGLMGQCSVCGKSLGRQEINPFVSPTAFSIRVDGAGSGGTRHRRSTLVRQRQALTHFIDNVPDEGFRDWGLFRVALLESGKLFRYNLGPENKGFVLCHTCGYGEPLRTYRPGKPHSRLRKLSGEIVCTNHKPWTNRLAFGHEFSSYCLVARPWILPGSVESVAFALQKGLSKVLQVESSDIGVSWRWLTKRSAASAGVEVILYDRTPGGSGFTKEGYENWERLVAEARAVCSECDCDRACYDCLKDYANQTYHDLLDRNAVLKFLAIT